MVKKYRYTFINKKNSRSGGFTLTSGLVSLVILAVCVAFSAAAHGQAGIFVGSVAIGGVLFAVYGFVLGIRQLKRHPEENFLLYGGTILSGAMMIAWLAVYLAGVN